MKKANAVEDRDTAFYNRAYEEHKGRHAGRRGSVDLHRRRLQRSARPRRAVPQDDPFQLNNISAKHPEVARSCSNS